MATGAGPGDGATRVARLYRAILAAIRAGRIGDGAHLPSSRAAAAGLGLSRNTVNAVYDLLRAEGLIDVRPGAAPVVRFAEAPQAGPARPGDGGGAPSLGARGRALATDPRQRSRVASDGAMAPGSPDEALFPADLWARALRRAARRRYGGAAIYGAFHGVPDLQEALAENLGSDRGLRVRPDRILVLPGTQAALALAAQVLADPGETAAVEDPGYAGARGAFLGAGLRLVPIPVDAEGADPGALAAEGRLRLIYLTPSNQYPLGHRLSHRRRLAFLARARAEGAVVIEDDYDGEFHWRGQEIAAMQALASGEEAIYLGTAAKALIPGLRLGWMVVPEALAEPMRQAQRNLGLGANLHAQAALADLMRSGEYRAHLRRTARILAERGAALVGALDARLGAAVTARLPDGGVQLAIRFEGLAEEAEAQRRLQALGFAPARLSGFGLSHCPTGLVTGFADATPERVARFVDGLAGVLMAGR